MMLFRRFGKSIARAGSAATLTLSLIVATLSFSAPASAQAGPPPCNTPVTSAPSGPATVAAASTPYGKVLVIGAGDYKGCSLYVLASDEIHALTSGAIAFACSDNPNPTGVPCDSVLWPALLTDGPPIAGPGVDQALLGTVTRTDFFFGTPVQQVTYAGLPLYRFTLDESPGQSAERDGANLFDPLTSPTGIWYLVEPRRGHPARGVAQLQIESAPVGSTGQYQTVLAVSMDDNSSPTPFPVYTLRADHSPGSSQGALPCSGTCAAVAWPPVLTSGSPQAGPGIDPNALGVIVRPDGTRQVTYKGQPLYLYWGDAYLPGIIGSETISGAGLKTPWGVFETVPLP